MKPSWKAHSTISICDIQHWIGKHKLHLKTNFSYENDKVSELDPVGSTVRYEMMKLCTGSV